MCCQCETDFTHQPGTEREKVQLLMGFIAVIQVCPDFGSCADQTVTSLGFTWYYIRKDTGWKDVIIADVYLVDCSPSSQRTG